MFYPLARHALFALDPETAHDVTFASLDRAAALGLARAFAPRLPASPVTVMGITFPNRVAWPPVSTRTRGTWRGSPRSASAFSRRAR
jgi:hypothetical protein